MAKPDATKEEMEAVLQKVNLLGFYRHRTDCRQSFSKKQETSPAASASVL